jgi:(p)ppGpp synthase/HD superfamily hydrolase
MDQHRLREESNLLEKALELAFKAHKGQKDRAGLPYILHPLRVMSRVQTNQQKIVALLHDVVEDSALTLEDLQAQGFPKAIVHAVNCLTKRDGEPYDALIQRALNDHLARAVKLADLEDNMDLRRNREQLNEKDLERFDKYRRAWAILSEAS